MKITIAAAVAALLGGCATVPYDYDAPYAYGPGPSYPYGYPYNQDYYGPPVISGGVVIGGGFGFDRGDWRGRGNDSEHWRGDRGNWRGDRGNWRGEDRVPDRPWDVFNPGPRHGPDARTPE